MVYTYKSKDGRQGAVDLGKVVSIQPLSAGYYQIRLSTPDGKKYETDNIAIENAEADGLIKAWKDFMAPGSVKG